MVKDRLPDLKGTLNDDCNETFALTIEEPKQTYMPEFFSQVEDLIECLRKIEGNVDEINRKQNSALAAPKVDQKMTQELENLMSEVKQSTNNARGRLNRMKADIEQDERTKNPASADFRIRKTQHAALASKFSDILLKYNNVQVSHREMCKQRIVRQLAITGRSTTEKEVEDMLEQENPSIFTQNIIPDTEEAKRSLADIQARHADIMKLEKSITELHQMFIEIADLIERQGGLINNIEQHVKDTVEYVEIAENHTRKAIQYQSKARQKKIILIVIGLIILVIIIVIIAVTAG